MKPTATYRQMRSMIETAPDLKFMSDSLICGYHHIVYQVSASEICGYPTKERYDVYSDCFQRVIFSGTIGECLAFLDEDIFDWLCDDPACEYDPTLEE